MLRVEGRMDVAFMMSSNVCTSAWGNRAFCDGLSDTAGHDADPGLSRILWGPNNELILLVTPGKQADDREQRQQGAESTRSNFENAKRLTEFGGRT